MKALVVANTGPMIAMAMIDRLDVLRSILDRIVVPEPVHGEIVERSRSGVGIACLQASWIERRSLIGQLLMTQNQI